MYDFCVFISWFEAVAKYCQDFGNLIPVAFVLGFYVSLVVSRFWEQFKSIPWPSRMSLFVSALVQGDDQRGRMMRRAIMRYLCLAYVLTTRSISPPVKKRFPSLQHVTEAGRKTCVFPCVVEILHYYGIIEIKDQLLSCDL